MRKSFLLFIVFAFSTLAFGQEMRADLPVQNKNKKYTYCKLVEEHNFFH